jgi:hypothetical protein
MVETMQLHLAALQQRSVQDLVELSVLKILLAFSGFYVASWNVNEAGNKYGNGS